MVSFPRLGPAQNTYIEGVLILLFTHDNNIITFLFSISLRCLNHASGAFKHFLYVHSVICQLGITGTGMKNYSKG
jgi:hypothetical protein